MPAFKFDANTRDYSRLNAYWLGQAALLTYQDEAGVRSQVEAWGLNDLSFFNQQETQAFIAGNEAVLILAFRGTTNLTDWMTDADIDLVGGPGGRVHEGFNVALNVVWREIWSVIREQRTGRALWVTGHSLGAALATLAVAKLRLEKDEPVNGLYTFGSPRAGDRDFARAFDADFERQTFRYVNNNDIVTRVPFRALHYSHVGTFKYFNNRGVQQEISWWDKIVDRVEGRIQELLEPGLDGIEDHNMTLYSANLERALGSGR